MFGNYNQKGKSKNHNDNQKKIENFILDDAPLDVNTYVEKAENVVDNLIKYYGENRKKLLTTSKIRGILSMINTIYNDLLNTKSIQLDDEMIGRIKYLKVKIVYDAGREESVKDFIKISNLLKYIDNINNKEDFILFSRYVEAIVAYRKFKGGKDE